MATQENSQHGSNFRRRTAQDALKELECFYTILHERVHIQGNKIYIDLPTSQDQIRPCLLVPIKQSEDPVYSWAIGQYAAKNPESASPPKQSYLAAREKIKLEINLPVSHSEETPARVPRSAQTPIPATSRHKVAGTSSLYVTDLGIGLIRIDKEGNENWVELWSQAQTPRVHRRLKVHDAYEGCHTLYDMTIGDERHTIPVGFLKSGKWVDLYSDMEGTISPKGHGQYVDAISTIAKQSPLVHAPQTTGYMNLGDDEKREYIYLLPDGRYITAQGDVCKNERVTLAQEVLSPQQKELWDAFTIPTTCTAIKQQEYFRFLRDLGPKTVLIVGHGVRAFTSAIRSPQWGVAHTMTILGDPGTGKTAQAAMGRGLWPYREKPLADGSYEDTVSSIEDQLAGFRSFPTIVDDLTSQKCATHGLSLSEGLKADRLARAVHDEKPPRKRMTASMQRQKSNLLQTCFFNTWEVTPTVPASFWRRTVLLTLKKNEVNIVPGQTGQASLADIEKHWNAQAYTFYQLIVQTLQELNTHGLDKVAELHKKMFVGIEKYLRVKGLQAWEQRYPGIAIPSDHHNLIKLYAQELLGLRILERSSGYQGLADYVMSCLIDAMVEQFARLAGIVEDEEGFKLFERAFIQLMEEIAQGKRVDGYIWRIDKKTSASGQIEPPVIVTSNGYKLPPALFAWDERPSEFAMYKTVIYMDESEDGYIYLTQEARKALLASIVKLPGGDHITSEMALGKVAESEGWIVAHMRESDKRRTYRITVPLGAPRTWVLPLKKYLAHFEGLEQENENVESEKVIPIRRADPRATPGRAESGQRRENAATVAQGSRGIAVADPPAQAEIYSFLIAEENIPEI